MTQPVDDLPIQLNLDDLEERRYPPYRFTLSGKSFVFSDPSVLDWQVPENLTTLDALALHCMPPDQRKAFFEIPLPSYKLDLLFEDVQRHFELGQYRNKRRSGLPS